MSAARIAIDRDHDAPMRGVLGTMLAVALLAPAHALAANAPPPPLTYLHVGAAGGPQGLAQIMDARDRTVLLKGANADGLVDYYRDDLKPPYPTDPAAYSNGACP